MGLLSAAFLGIVQGLTEFLPVSSTAHLLVVGHLIGYDDPGGVFTATIQFGSILAVMWVYRARLLSVVRGLSSEPSARRFALMILAAFVPAAVLGKGLKGFIKGVLYASPGVMATALILGGIVMLIVEWRRPASVIRNAADTPLPRAVGIGMCQTLALVPGVSRSGATIVGGLLLGLERTAAAEFSFFLAMPTMAAVFADDLWGARHQLAPERGLEIAVGFAMAFLAALLVVRPFLTFVSRAGFASFAWYRILAGAVLFALLAAGKL